MAQIAPQTDQSLIASAKALMTKSTPGVTDSTVEEILKSLQSTAGGQELLADVVNSHEASSIPPTIITTMAVAGWNNECDANAQVGCVVFFMTARLSTNSPIDKTGASKNGGFYTPGFQTTWGKYGYNDQNVQGGDVTTMVSCQGVACQITVFKNNQPVGFYIGGGVGTVVGTGGGTMSW